MVSVISLCSGLACSIIYYAQSNEYISASLTWWQYLLIALIPSVLGFGFELLIDVMKSKGYITEDDAKELKEDIDDLKDKIENVTKDKDEKTSGK